MYGKRKKARQQTHLAATQQLKLNPKPKPTTQANPQPHLKPKPKTQAKPRPQAKPKPQANPRPNPKPPQSKAKPRPQVQAKAKPRPQVQAKAKAKPRPQIQAKAKPRPQVQAKAKPRPQVQAKAKAKPRPQVQAKAKAKPKAKPRPRQQPARVKPKPRPPPIQAKSHPSPPQNPNLARQQRQQNQSQEVECVLNSTMKSDHGSLGLETSEPSSISLNVETLCEPDGCISPRSCFSFTSLKSTLPVLHQPTMAAARHDTIASVPVAISKINVSGPRSVYVIGDEHSNYGWYNAALLLSASGITYHNHCVGPKLMYTMARDGFKNVQHKCPLHIAPQDFLVFVFGELDVKCHTLKWAELKNKTLKQTLEELIPHYLAKIHKTFTHQVQSSAHIIIRSVLPPPCADKSDTNFNSLLNESLSQQMELVTLMNQTLREKCLEYGFLFGDINASYTDEHGFLDLNKTQYQTYIHDNYAYDNLKIIHQLILQTLHRESLLG